MILDIRMPNLNGYDVLEKLLHLNADPVVIVLAAFAYRQYRNRCLEAGAAHFFLRRGDGVQAYLRRVWGAAGPPNTSGEPVMPVARAGYEVGGTRILCAQRGLSEHFVDQSEQWEMERAWSAACRRPASRLS